MEMVISGLACIFLGYVLGKQLGRDEGYSKGSNEGFKSGYDRGYSDATNKYLEERAMHYDVDKDYDELVAF